MTDLKLLALDEEDLDDHLCPYAGCGLQGRRYGLCRPARQFTVVANRFVWEKAQRKTEELRAPPRGADFQARQAVRSIGIDRADTNRCCRCWRIRFGQKGEGLKDASNSCCAGGGTIVLDVECIEVQLADTGGAWETDITAQAIPARLSAVTQSGRSWHVTAQGKRVPVAIWLEQASSDFEARFAAFLTTKREVSEDVNAVVATIIDDVRARGDAALADYSLRFDGLDFCQRADAGHCRGDRRRLPPVDAGGSRCAGAGRRAD